MLIQFHLLQNYAPANLNRDDSGSPKDAFFGGYRRGRISSQCLKRSIRKSVAFTETFDDNGLLGMRTKALPDLIRRELECLGASQDAVRAIVAAVPKIGRKSKKDKEVDKGDEDEKTTDETTAQDGTKEKKDETRQLIFIGKNELRPLAETMLALYKEHGPKKWDKLDIDASLGKSLPRSVDIAMFGRMTTAATFEDVKAAVQVAHALSTNALAAEFDYYTAVDDLSGESGAGMIGDIEFNSSTYYKYLNIHWEQLVKNLGDDLAVARQAILALLEAAATSQPSGKQNSFAAHNPPDLILVEVSERNLPVSYANAFIIPARPSEQRSLMDESARLLGEYAARLIRMYDLQAKRAIVATQKYTLPIDAEFDSLAKLKKWLEDQLPGCTDDQHALS